MSNGAVILLKTVPIGGVYNAQIGIGRNSKDFVIKFTQVFQLKQADGLNLKHASSG